MRFRAQINEIKTLYRIFQTVEKLAKTCTIRWNEEYMQIIVAGKDNEHGVQVWSKVRVDTLFAEYKIQSNANNEINLDVPTASFVRALKNGQNSTKSVLKLARKNEMAVMSFEFETTTSKNARRLRATHDIRIDVLRSSVVDEMTEPQCPDPNVYIVLPKLFDLRTVMDHMRPLSNLVRVSATRNGGLKLRIETEDVGLETVWEKCALPPIEYSNAEEVDKDEFFDTIVHIRSLLQFLSSHVVSHTTIAGLCEGHCLIMYVYIFEGDDQGGVLTFYIPAAVP